MVLSEAVSRGLNVSPESWWVRRLASYSAWADSLSGPQEVDDVAVLCGPPR